MEESYSNMDENQAVPTKSRDSEPEEILTSYSTLEDDFPIQKALTQEVVLTWKAVFPLIPLFNPAKEKPHLVNSPRFLVGDDIDCPTHWIVQVSHDFWYNNRERTVAIYLWRIGDDQFGEDVEDVAAQTLNKLTPHTISVIYKVEILDEEGITRFTEDSGMRPFNKGVAYGWKNFAKYSEVKHLILNNSLRIRATVKVVNIVEIKLNPLSDPVLKDKTAIIEVKYLEDFVENIERVILLSSSPAFVELIVSNDGNHKKEIDLGLPDSSEFKNITGKIVQDMLSFLRTGSCLLLTKPNGNLTRKIALFGLGQAYELEGLKLSIVSSMVDFLSPQTAPKVFGFMTFYKLKEKKEYAKFWNKLQIYFIMNLEAIKVTEEFRKLYYKHYEKCVDLVLALPLPE